MGGLAGDRNPEGIATADGRDRPAARLQAQLRLSGGAELRRGPRLAQAAAEFLGQLTDRDPRLVQRVAVAQGDRVVLHRLVVDRDAPGRADLVLAAVALADRSAGVELGEHQLAQLLVDLARLLRLSVLVDQR